MCDSRTGSPLLEQPQPRLLQEASQFAQVLLQSHERDECALPSDCHFRVEVWPVELAKVRMTRASTTVFASSAA